MQRTQIKLSHSVVEVIHTPFSDIPTAVDEIRAGRMVIVVDDEDRENEGDLTVAAEMITPEMAYAAPGLSKQ